jgi:hypothetical protein
MKPDLEAMLAALRDRPADVHLDQLEPRVWARIGAIARSEGAHALRFRAALAAAMLGLGILAGGAAASPVSELSPFAIHSAYAPSTLLEGGQ